MQATRLFQIIYILLQKGSVTAGELARHFEVSRRTIYRDIDTLSLAGIPVYTSKGREAEFVFCQGLSWTNPCSVIQSRMIYLLRYRDLPLLDLVTVPLY
ncbi:MAG: HTH domain-containing protein [Clostridiales bacterium]|nr:HTH domain-containing protein [Clostridiales bacterium]